MRNRICKQKQTDEVAPSVHNLNYVPEARPTFRTREQCAIAKFSRQMETASPLLHRFEFQFEKKTLIKEAFP